MVIRQKINIFAAAMISSKQFNINLRSAAQAGKPLEFKLDDIFFEELDQQEILRGDAVATLVVSLTSGGFFELRFDIQGRITVACDRCLDDLDFVIDAQDIRKVASFDAISDDEETPVLHRDGTYDISWDLYEIAELSLPIQRMHEANECNAEMMARLAELSTTADNLDEDEEV